MSKSIVAASAIALTLAASPALALKFDFTGPDSIFVSDGDGGGTFNLAGISGTVTASASTIINNPKVTTETNGLGVSSSGIDQDTDIDGWPATETLLFTFTSGAVDLGSLSFGDVDGDDDGSIKVNGVTVDSENSVNPFPFGSGGIGATSFSVTANAFNDSFTVDSFTVVPLPGGLPLIVTGAALFGLAARRKRT